MTETALRATLKPSAAGSAPLGSEPGSPVAQRGKPSTLGGPRTMWGSRWPQALLNCPSTQINSQENRSPSVTTAPRGQRQSRPAGPVRENCHGPASSTLLWLLRRGTILSPSWASAHAHFPD